MSKTKRNNTAIGRGAAALAVGLLLGGMGGVCAQPATSQNTQKRQDQNSLKDWQKLDQEKDGAVYIQFDIPSAWSRVYHWRFRSTFDHPIHVDYRIDTSTPEGFPLGLHRTAYIPAEGRTDRFGVPSFLEPGISIDRVR